MKTLILFFFMLTCSILAFGQTATEPAINWADFTAEILTVLLTVIAIIGRYFIKGSKADILEWVKKIINFILDFLPAKDKDGTINKFGESYKN